MWVSLGPNEHKSEASKQLGDTVVYSDAQFKD